MCSSVDYWRCRWIKLGGALEYPQRGPSDPHPGPDLSTACPQGYPQGWREDPQGVENGTRRCGDAHISPRRRRGRRRAGPTGRSASRSPCGRAGLAPPLRLWLAAALPRHRSPRAVPSARSRWARSPVRHPLAPGPRDQVRQLGPRGEHGTRSLPGRAVRSKPRGSIRDGRVPQGRRPASAPSGRPSRPGCSMVDIVGVLSRTRIGSESEGLPAQRGRGQAGGRRCTRGRRHTRPVRPVRLGAGTGGPVAERSGDSKRWPARIFHPPPRAPPIPKWCNDAIPRTRRSRRAPESHAPATFFRPADAPGRNGGAAGGLHRARTVIGTGPAATAGVASRSPRGNHRTAPGPARVSRIRADAESAAPARGGRRPRSAPTARPAWWDGVSHVVTRPARLDHLRAVGPPGSRNTVVQRNASGPTARKWSNRTQVVQPHASGPSRGAPP